MAQVSLSDDGTGIANVLTMETITSVQFNPDATASRMLSSPQGQPGLTRNVERRASFREELRSHEAPPKTREDARPERAHDGETGPAGRGNAGHDRDSGRVRGLGPRHGHKTLPSKSNPDQSACEPDVSENPQMAVWPHVSLPEAIQILKTFYADILGDMPVDGLDADFPPQSANPTAPMFPPAGRGIASAATQGDTFPGPGLSFLALLEGRSGDLQAGFRPVPASGVPPPAESQSGRTDLDELLAVLTGNRAWRPVSEGVSASQATAERGGGDAVMNGLQAIASDDVSSTEESMAHAPAAVPVIELEIDIENGFGTSTDAGREGPHQEAGGSGQTVSTSAALGNYHAVAALKGGDLHEAVNGAAGRIVEQMREPVVHAVRTGLDSIHIRLKPEGLGELHIDVVRQDNNEVTLKIMATTQGARQVIEAGLTDLRSQIQASGLTLNDVKISSRDQQENGHAHQHSHNGEGGNRRQSRENFKEHMS